MKNSHYYSSEPIARTVNLAVSSDVVIVGSSRVTPAGSGPRFYEVKRGVLSTGGVAIWPRSSVACKWAVNSDMICHCVYLFIFFWRRGCWGLSRNICTLKATYICSPYVTDSPILAVREHSWTQVDLLNTDSYNEYFSRSLYNGHHQWRR